MPNKIIDIKNNDFKNEDSKTVVAYNIIKQNIIRNKLKPNAILIENQLCESLKMSRTPIRNAFSMLLSDGFLHYIKNKGIFVSVINISDIIEIYSIRSVLDPFIIGECLRKNKPNIYEQLKNNIESCEKAINNNNNEKFIEQDFEFHKIYMFGSDYKILNSFLNSIMDQLLRFSFTTVGDIERARKSVAQHRKILEAYGQKDIEKVKDCAREHIEDIKQYYIYRNINNLL